jgi:uncharacterized membrane protein
MSNTRLLEKIGAVAGLGVAIGATAAAAYRHGRGESHGRGDAPSYTARGKKDRLDIVGRTVTIGKARDELFAFWRDFTNLPKVMENVESIQPKGGSHDPAVWTIKAPGGGTVAVETEVCEEEDGRLIAWRSVAGSDIETNGRVTFSDAPGDRGTRVSLIIAYDPPAGETGRAIAKMFLREPEIQARHDLKRFKMLMETGEVATSARRSDQTRAARQENG